MSDKKEKLSPRREAFCEMYTCNDREMFGNGIRSYIEVYKPDTSKPNWYKTASASSSRMLANVKIINRINELLERQGFNDENVEKQHLFLLNQHVDLKTKMKAIDSYYKLKGKNEPEKLIITEYTDEQIKTIANRIGGNGKPSGEKELN